QQHATHAMVDRDLVLRRLLDLPKRRHDVPDLADPSITRLSSRGLFLELVLHSSAGASVARERENLAVLAIDETPARLPVRARYMRLSGED
ncbi:MAG: hypothetical protein ACTHQQ_04635, partial [Solirubrobacteraceae bacterium]